jgi:hypothetical protein
MHESLAKSGTKVKIHTAPNQATIYDPPIEGRIRYDADSYGWVEVTTQDSSVFTHVSCLSCKENDLVTPNNSSDEVIRQLREMISLVGGIGNYAAGHISENRERVTVRTSVMVSINEDSLKLRKKIRELAQTIGVEY